MECSRDECTAKTSNAATNGKMNLSPKDQRISNEEPEMDSINKFHVDVSKIQAVPSSQQQSELQQLGLTVFDQQEFEQGVTFLL